MYDDSLARVVVMDRLEASKKKDHWVLRYGYKADPEIRQTVWVRKEDWVVTRIQRGSRREMVAFVFRKAELGTRRAKWLRR